MIATIAILIISTAMFAYWFRYTCLLILNTKTSTDYAGDVAAANQLSFLAVQTEILTADRGRLAALHRSLDRDYSLISNLLEKSLGAGDEGGTLEQVMLKIDFLAMRAAFRLSRPLSDKLARRSLSEMTSVVAHLANLFGEQQLAGSQSR
jgi:hypothetical protein